MRVRRSATTKSWCATRRRRSWRAGVTSRASPGSSRSTRATATGCAPAAVSLLHTCCRQFLTHEGVGHALSFVVIPVLARPVVCHTASERRFLRLSVAGSAQRTVPLVLQPRRGGASGAATPGGRSPARCRRRTLLRFLQAHSRGLRCVHVCLQQAGCSENAEVGTNRTRPDSRRLCAGTGASHARPLCTFSCATCCGPPQVCSVRNGCVLPGAVMLQVITNFLSC